MMNKKKKKNGSKVVAGAVELEVADILLRLPEIIGVPDSRSLVCWEYKRKRTGTGVDDNLPRPRTCQNVSSPATALSFSPVEPARKRRRINVLYTKKEEQWSKTVDDLNHQKELLKLEIENVKLLHNRMKALNLELKAQNQQSNLDMANPQPLQLFPCHPGGVTSASVASTSGSDITVAPMETVHLSPPPAGLNLNLDLSLALNAAQMKRAEAVEARKKRRQIRKGKKSKGCSVASNSIPQKAYYSTHYSLSPYRS